MRFDEEDRFCISIAEDLLGMDAPTFNETWAHIGAVKPYLLQMKAALSDQEYADISYQDAKMWLLENTDIGEQSRPNFADEGYKEFQDQEPEEREERPNRSFPSNRGGGGWVRR